MDNINEQDSSLRKNFNLLVKKIMGNNYYTIAPDVVSSDIEAIKDIEKKFINLTNDMKWWRTIAIIMMIISLVLLMFM